MRPIAMLLLCLTLAACGSSVELPLWKGYVPPSMPTMDATTKGVKQAAAEEKVTGQIEMSDLRPTDHGPGHFVVCIRGTESIQNRVGYYAVFFDNDEYKGSRASVILDDCEKQSYHPVP